MGVNVGRGCVEKSSGGLNRKGFQKNTTMSSNLSINATQIKGIVSINMSVPPKVLDAE